MPGNATATATNSACHADMKEEIGCGGTTATRSFDHAMSCAAKETAGTDLGPGAARTAVAD